MKSLTFSKVKCRECSTVFVREKIGIFKVKCRAFSFRKMFYMAGTFFWLNIFTPIASIVSVPGIFYSASSLRTLLIIRVLIIQDKWPFLLPYIVSHSPPALLKIVLNDNARYIHL